MPNPDAIFTELTAPFGAGDAMQAEAAFAEGVQQQSQGDLAAARASFERALQLQPRLAEAWSNLGMVLEDSGEPDPAEACYARALAINPKLHAAVMNLAMLQAAQGRLAEAESGYQRAIQLQPNDPAAWSNLGAMLTCLRREDDALACLTHATRLDASYDKARFNLGYLWLRQGRLAEGWLCNESRPWPAEVQAKLGIARWAGERLDGRKLLIAVDAGHGDVIHMVRYVAELKGLGASQIAIWGQPALKRWLSTVPGLDRYIAFDEPFDPSEWDCWAPLMSLGHLCGTALDTIPARLPYLQADPAKAALRARQGMARREGPELRVGLVWRGNPAHENDAQRSLPTLSVLAPLWQVPGVRFFSLQSGAGSEEALHPPPGQSFESLGEPLGDFADTAAVVANLDLVIGVDTSMVHVAGAMGKPVWVLLSDYKTDWRWMNAREDSPWYPGVMRLFRQDASRQWAPVIARVAQALADVVAGRSAGHAAADAAADVVAP